MGRESNDPEESSPLRSSKAMEGEDEGENFSTDGNRFSAAGDENGSTRNNNDKRKSGETKRTSDGSEENEGKMSKVTQGQGKVITPIAVVEGFDEVELGDGRGDSQSANKKKKNNSNSNDPSAAADDIDGVDTLKPTDNTGGKDETDAASVYSYYMEESGFRYYFQHPYARLFTAYFVVLCNFLIYAEDPVAHSRKECNIPAVGNCFSFVCMQYPRNAWSLLKVVLWLMAIIIGLIVGKLLFHTLLFSEYK